MRECFREEKNLLLYNNSNSNEEKPARQLSCPQEEVESTGRTAFTRLVATEEIPVN